MTNMLSSSLKTQKSINHGYDTAILYLAPHDLAREGKSVCPNATPECIAYCLNTAGNPAHYKSKEAARVYRTNIFWDNRGLFLGQIALEIEKFVKKCKRKNLLPSVRLNGTSDLPFEKYKFNFRGKSKRNMFDHFPDVQFYDYTKSVNRANSKLPSNLSLTYSHNELSHLQPKKELAKLKSIAYIYHIDRVTDSVDGDIHDLRFIDTKRFVGLKAKGLAKAIDKDNINPKTKKYDFSLDSLRIYS